MDLYGLLHGHGKLNVFCVYGEWDNHNSANVEQLKDTPSYPPLSLAIHVYIHAYIHWTDNTVPQSSVVF